MNNNIQQFNVTTKAGNTLSFFYNPENNLVVVMNNNIQQFNVITKAGNTLSFFYNPENNLVVVDLVHKNEQGGTELLRKTLDEKRMLVHAVDAGDAVECRKEEDSEKAKAWK